VITRVTRVGLVCLAFWLALLPGMVRAQPAGPPDPRFGIVETFANPPAAAEAGAGFTRIILPALGCDPAGQPSRLETGQRARSAGCG